MPPKPWRCGECGATLVGDVDVEAHFLGHPIPAAAVPAETCKHPPLAVDVTPSRVYLWARTDTASDSGLGTHPGWGRGGTPSVIRGIVETENGSSLAVPGLYYPHTRTGARFLDGIYHDLARTDAEAKRAQSVSAATGRVPRFTRTVSDDTARIRRSRAIAAGELAGGIALGVVGANLMYACTQFVPFDGCAEHGYGLYGFIVLFPGLCVALVGLASMLSTIGKTPGALPEGWRPGGLRTGPEVSAGVERTASIIWGGILMGILLAVEAFPTYNLVLLTQSGRPPTFNLGAFLADMAFFIVADLILVSLVVTYTAGD